MPDKSPLFRITQFPGLGGKKPSRVDKKYASFNRRMMAVTLDTLFMAALAPLVDKLFNALWGAVSMDWPALQERMLAQASERNSAILFWQELYQSGVLSRFVANNLVQMAVLFLLTAYCWHRWAATPGKMIMRLRVVDAVTEQPISDRQIALRLLGYIVSVIPPFIGTFWIAFDSRRQGWHDKIAHTVVITVPWKKAKPGSAIADPSGSSAPSATE